MDNMDFEKTQKNLFRELMNSSGLSAVHDYNDGADRRSRDMLMDSAPKDSSRKNDERQDIIHKARSNEQLLGDRLSILKTMQKAMADNWDFLYDTATGLLGKDSPDEEKKKVHIIGIGPGDAGSITNDALKALLACELIVGNHNDLQMVTDILSKEAPDNESGRMKTLEADNTDDIKTIINREIARNICVIYRGDVGYYDSAGDILKDEIFADADIIPGVSVLGYFAAKMKLSCESGPVIEFNDASSPLIYEISKREYVFLILNGKDVVRKLSARLLDFGFRDVFISIGFDVGSLSGEFITGKPLEFMRVDKSGIFPAVIHNPTPLEPKVTGRIDDRYFAGDRIPRYGAMVRSAILSELCLNEDSTSYVIGAGVGECAIECALCCPRGKVYALDESVENIQLMRINRRQFLAENMEIVQGTGPEIIENITYPDRVLICGELPQMRRIISIIFRKNRHCIMVICTQDVQVLTGIVDVVGSFPRLESSMSSVRASYSGYPGERIGYGSEREVYVITCRLKEDNVAKAPPDTGIVSGAATTSWVPEEL